MGVLPELLPGYRLVSDAQARQRLATLWGVAAPAEPGQTYDQMLDGGVRALYVLGADPARDATPEQQARLNQLEFLVVQDLFLTETAQRAHIVLPAVAYTEKDGTFTNTERCIQVVRRAMTELPGARADWAILTDVARALDLAWSYASPSDVLDEIATALPIYAGASRRALGSGGARWPLMHSSSDTAGPVAETPYLTWAHLEHGLATGEDEDETDLVPPHGREEQD
jgi:predicted molibdopterin-dependent oxidoreductase YjgC